MRRVMIVAVLAFALVAAMAIPASAATRITCLANGFVDVEGTGPYTWNVFGSGPCYDSLQGNFFVNFSGSGTSASLGLCDGLIVQNLNLSVNHNVLNLRTLQTTEVTQNWRSPITTFPIVTPFFISKAEGGSVGLGLFSTRVLLSCPPAGSHVATFLFTTAV